MIAAATSAALWKIMAHEPLLIGIDAGGTQCRAWLARVDARDDVLGATAGLSSRAGSTDGQAIRGTRHPSSVDEFSVLGRGIGGPVNPQAVGFPAALENLNAAVSAAFAEAYLPRAPVESAVLAAAGSDREANRAAFMQWAHDSRLAKRFLVVHDALPVLMAGCPAGWGIALISGTGSLAFGRAPDGRAARSGGWGYLIGDEGSAYAVALAGLRAAAQAADGRAPSTQLLDAFLERFRLARAEELIPAVYAIQNDRAALAALAKIVHQTAAGGDAAAQNILDRAARDLAQMVAAVARRLDFAPSSFPLALTGGMLLDSADLRDGLRAALLDAGYGEITPVSVPEPVRGALQLALAEYRNTNE
jgi:N-acetylmuramic acid 6-phosphate etherase